MPIPYGRSNFNSTFCFICRLNFLARIYAIRFVVELQYRKTRVEDKRQIRIGWDL